MNATNQPTTVAHTSELSEIVRLVDDALERLNRHALTTDCPRPGIVEGADLLDIARAFLALNVIEATDGKG